MNYLPTRLIPVKSSSVNNVVPIVLPSTLMLPYSPLPYYSITLFLRPRDLLNLDENNPGRRMNDLDSHPIQSIIRNVS